MSAALAACSKARSHPVPQSASTSPSASSATARTARVRFIDDDMPRARRLASADHKALFVDAWAPWCHTCTSMRGFVLGDPALDRYTDRVVFAAVDTDRETNSEFLRRYDVTVWPSFFVLDPDSGKVAGYWPGSASLGELTRFIDQALDTVRRTRASGLDPSSPLTRLIGAQSAEIAHDWARAARSYAEAAAGLAPETDDWSEAVHGRLRALGALGSVSECVDLGTSTLDRITGVARPVDFASDLMACSRRLPNGSRKTAALAAIETRMRRYADAPPSSAAADDRSEALGVLADARSAQGRGDDARRAVEERLALLDGAAAGAPSPALAQAFDAARVSSELALGRGDDAVALLTERERELPDAYDPPARLAEVLVRLGRTQQAVAALERAVSRATGVRKADYLERKASLETELGDRVGAIAALRALVAALEALPEPLADTDRLARARSRLAEVERRALSHASH